MLALIFTYRVRAWAPRVGLVDVPDQGRHDHPRPVARAGGIAVYASVLLVLGVVVALGRPPYLPLLPGIPLLALLAGATAMFALGLRDDARPLSARTKFPVQVLIAVGVFLAGVRIESFPLFGGPDGSLPLPVSLIVSVVWLVGVTNAFNLIDGSDGVAAGAAVLACLAIGAVSFMNGNFFAVVICMTLAGASLGFLFFNFPPATIFLGDSGSLFIGFMLAAGGIVTTQTATTALAIAIPVVSLGLPILDTLLVMARRFLRGKPLFQGDRRHIHHVLRDLGHSPRKVALVIYAVCGGFALLSLLLVQPHGAQLGVPLAVAGLIVWVAVQRLRIPELVEIGHVVGRSMAQREVIAHNMRIRDAVARMRRAADPVALLAALESAFEGSEFRRAELWLPLDIARPLLGTRSTRLSADGCLWRWAAPDPFQDGAAFEVRLPFCDADGRPIGRISVWRPLEGQRLFTDVRLLANQLLPELQHGLRRFRAAPTPAHIGSTHWRHRSGLVPDGTTVHAGSG